MLHSEAEKKHEYYIRNKRRWRDVYEQKDGYRERHNERGKQLRQEQKLLVLSHYSRGTPYCARCGIDDIDVLSIDHINGGGTQHRRTVNPHTYRFLIKENFPEGFQVLCFNCNWKKRLESK